MRCYDIEATWLSEKYVPAFDEYMQNALVTGSNFLHGISSFMSMGEVATVESFDWAAKKPKILIASNTVGRLIDDIMTHEVYIYIDIDACIHAFMYLVNQLYTTSQLISN